MSRSTVNMAKAMESLARNLSRPPITHHDYIRNAWPVLEPSRPFIGNWHIDLMADYLTAVDIGQITRLVINVPPRHMKSLAVSVFWPTWCWIRRPWLRWVFTSYSQSLSVKHSIDRRQVIESDWYQERWGSAVRLAEDQNQKMEFQNDQRGVMVATSVGGTLTGKGGDRIVVDDLINPLDSESEAARDTAIRFFDSTLRTRLDDQKTGAIVVIEQRLHKKDLTGHLLAEGGWTHLKIPAYVEDRERIVFPVTKRTVDREPGSTIWPKESRETLDRLKNGMGSRSFGAQYLQNPTSDEGGILKRAWWEYYREAPKARRMVWAWDTAVKTKEANDYTAGFLIAECKDGYYILRHVKERMEYPDLKRTVENEYAARRVEAVLIEDTSSGQQLIQDFRRSTRLPVIPFTADKDKVQRANLVSPTIEARKVFLPEGQPWVADFVENCAAFPNVDHDDDIDALVIGLMYLTGKVTDQVPKVTVI